MKITIGRQHWTAARGLELGCQAHINELQDEGLQFWPKSAQSWRIMQTGTDGVQMYHREG